MNIIKLFSSILLCLNRNILLKFNIEWVMLVSCLILIFPNTWGINDSTITIKTVHMFHFFLVQTVKNASNLYFPLKVFLFNHFADSASNISHFILQNLDHAYVKKNQLDAFPEVKNISIFLYSVRVHRLWNDNHSSLYLPSNHHLQIIKTLLFSRVYKAELNFAIYSLILLIIIIMY